MKMMILKLNRKFRLSFKVECIICLKAKKPQRQKEPFVVFLLSGFFIPEIYKKELD